MEMERWRIEEKNTWHLDKNHSMIGISKPQSRYLRNLLFSKKIRQFLSYILSKLWRNYVDKDI